MPPPPAPLTLARNFALALLPPSTPTSPPTYDHPILTAMTITSASLTPTPTVTTRLTVTPELCNALGTFHGGAIATVFDLCTTLPIALLRRPLPSHPPDTTSAAERGGGDEDEGGRDGDGDGDRDAGDKVGEEGNEVFWQAAGVSRTLSLTYLSPVFAGEEVELVAELMSFGGRLAQVRGVMRKVAKDDGGEVEGKEGGGGDRVGGEVKGVGKVVATAEHGKVNIDGMGVSRSRSRNRREGGKGVKRERGRGGSKL